MEEDKSYLLQGIISYLINSAAVEMTANLGIISREERTLSICHSSKVPVARKGSNENALHSLVHIAKGNRVRSVSLSM